MQRAFLRALHAGFNCISLSFISTSRLALNLTCKNHTQTNHRLSFSEIPITIKLYNLTLVQMIQDCIKNNPISHGKQLHSYALRTGFASDVYVATALVSYYAKLVSLDDAHKLFDEMPQRNVVSWNAVISGYIRAGKLWRALSLFIELNQSVDVRADAYSFTSALAACGQLNLLHFGMSIHSKVIVYGMGSSNVVANCLIDAYGKCSLEADAMRVFHELSCKDVISWNSVISACARNQRLELALQYFYQMPCPDTLTYNEMISGMSQFGDIDEAIRFLKSMPTPNSSSWNAIISGYLVRKIAGEALNFFADMHTEAVEMDEFTFSSILSGIACVSALRWGTVVHCYSIKHGCVTSMIVGSALVDMYSKCGKVEDAEMVFRFMAQKNIVTWNALMSGLRNNGESHQVVQYYEELKGAKKSKPDDITFVNVLAACAHGQMPLEKACGYLTSMMDDYGIKPKPEHVAPVIRLMGHHGELSKAEKMIYDLEFGSCSPIWRALLGACVACGDLEIAKVAARKLMELENDEIGYVILSNINKDRGNWKDASQVWEQMRDRGVTKDIGFSWIEGRKLAV